MGGNFRRQKEKLIISVNVSFFTDESVTSVFFEVQFYQTGLVLHNSVYRKCLRTLMFCTQHTVLSDSKLTNRTQLEIVIRSTLFVKVNPCVELLVPTVQLKFSFTAQV